MGFVEIEDSGLVVLQGMRRGKRVGTLPLRWRLVQVLIVVGVLYFILMTFEVPFVFRAGVSEISKEGFDGFTEVYKDGLNGFSEVSNKDLNGVLIDSVSRHFQLELEDMDKNPSPLRPLSLPVTLSSIESSKSKTEAVDYKIISGLVFQGTNPNSSTKDGFSLMQKAAKGAWEAGRRLWEEIESGNFPIEANIMNESGTESCPNSIFLPGTDFLELKQVMVIPCGLALGSSIVLVGKPSVAPPRIAFLKKSDGRVKVSQFMIELQGLKIAEGEEPPRILHFNPRLKGDWSGRPAIEMNTCYRMQWGDAVRCEGSESKSEKERVDKQAICEKWLHDDGRKTEESSKSRRMNRLIGRMKKIDFKWPYPFVEDKHFVLTISAGLEGYHMNVDGRHIASFPYHIGFSLGDATGLFVKGDIDVHSIFAASLPTSHPIFAPQQHLEMSTRWVVPAHSDGPVEIFIGILSAGHHFAERMAVRKSWMQHWLIRSSRVVARFFIAMHMKKEINVEVKKEAEFFGDIVIVPYIDNYDLVVLKTVAICEYGVHTVGAKYIMKCDDDTFVRPDVVLKQVTRIGVQTVYSGNMNIHHKPMRAGKWAVKYEEWQEEEYPPYANGAGYIFSSDIAQFIVSEFESHRLRLFKMEDVSMGMWVEQFNGSEPVVYLHNVRYCHHGCIENYYTAHYQAPRQMICLWNRLQQESFRMRTRCIRTCLGYPVVGFPNAHKKVKNYC